ncbi:MAG: hypothetical protein WBW16_08685 [Bacteroidota bacterium]
MEKNIDIKYTVTAIIDLLGFSSHLEIGAYDIRTNIGQEAIKRLRFLEDALMLMENEEASYPDYYPANLQVRRINDAIFLTIDLPDFLMPSIGQAIRRGMSANELREIFSKDELKDEETFLKSYNSRITLSVEPLVKFIGLVSRLYSYINRQENNSYFPGAKAVLATGFRKPFYVKANAKEDVFSANFSLSNAYIAESQLKGAYFYLDNYIVQLLAGHPFGKNIMRYSLFVSKDIKFDPFEEYEDLFYLPSEYTIPQPVEIRLFRKPFFFRQVGATPLSYLQILPEILPYLSGEKEAYLNHVFKEIYLSIKSGPSPECIRERKRPNSWIYVARSDIEDDINLIPELLATGKSERLEKEKEMAIQRSIYSSFDEINGEDKV